MRWKLRASASWPSGRGDATRAYGEVGFEGLIEQRAAAAMAELAGLENPKIREVNEKRWCADTTIGRKVLAHARAARARRATRATVLFSGGS
jgi:hypothetical protein